MSSTRQQRRAIARAATKLEVMSAKSEERGRQRADAKRFYQESKELSFKERMLALAKLVFHILGWQYYAIQATIKHASRKKNNQKKS